MVCLTEFECAVYADGELPPRDTREMEEHLETCPACRQFVGALRAESRVLVECFQSIDFIEFELEDETLSAPRAQSLGMVRFTAFVLAMSVLLRPALAFLDDIGLLESLNWLAITATYLIPTGFSLMDSAFSNASWIALVAILFIALALFPRRSVVTNSILSLLALLTVFSSSSYGLDLRRSDRPVTIPPGETVDDTLIVAGDSVTVDGTVTGDLIAFVREVTIRGTVKGNVISIARRVVLEGTVEGSVIGFAQTVETRGRVAHNIYAFAQTVDVDREARVDENATMIASEADIEGTIGKDAFARAGSVNVSPAARIGGTFSARINAPRNVRIAPGAIIGGKTDIQTSRTGPSRYATLSFYVWQTIWLTAAFLTGLLLFRIIPSLSRVSFDTTRELLLSAGLGFLALVAVPAAAILAAITLIGLPLAAIGLATWMITAYLAKIVIAGFVGRSLLRSAGDPDAATALALFAGLLAVSLSINLPYIGSLVNFFLIVLGLGTIVSRTYRTLQLRSAQAA